MATTDTPKKPAHTPPAQQTTEPPVKQPVQQHPKQPEGERGGSDKPEPTRYGDWEVDGRCTDF